MLLISLNCQRPAFNCQLLFPGLWSSLWWTALFPPSGHCRLCSPWLLSSTAKSLQPGEQSRGTFPSMGYSWRQPALLLSGLALLRTDGRTRPKKLQCYQPCATPSACSSESLLAPIGFLLAGSVLELGRKITVWLTNTTKLPESALKHRKGVLQLTWSTVLPILCISGGKDPGWW